jgi:hypothetical protein
MASCGLLTNTPITVSVRNSANAAQVNIPVRYRVNGGTWITETIPSIAANTTIAYTFSTRANLSAIGNYTLQSLVDLAADSFRENDTVSTVIINAPVITTYPYLQGFEQDNGNWYTGGHNSSWQYGTPVSPKINHAANGAKAWKTRLAGNYNDLETSYLFSPCFDLTGLTKPTLSFSMAADLEDCGTSLCDGVWLEYSTDGVTWIKLGASGSGTNWYNKATDQLWSIQDDTKWHVATIDLPAGFNRMRFRFVMTSDPAVNREGFAIDDIHVYDNTRGIYSGPSLTAGVAQNVSGNGWVDFTSGGQLLASVLPNNQNLGSTAVQAYINTGAVRFTNNQYYHQRNITIKPSQAPNDSVRVRFYFLDSETKLMQAAASCSTCIAPASAYELGISKYSDPDQNIENGTVLDNNIGTWLYLPSSQVRKVPFDKGYYAEFSVRSFSEFWLNSGGADAITPLPVKLLDFTAQRQQEDALLRWSVAAEQDVVRYEVEVARGDAALVAAQFSLIGQVASPGPISTTRLYNYLDKETGKSGNRYYRLKIIDALGGFRYSPVRPVLFDDLLQWTVYPNPSKGNFQLYYQLTTGQKLTAKVYDAQGRKLWETAENGNGLLQKITVDLTRPYFAAGVYLMQVEAEGKTRSFKLYKE